MPIKTDPIGLTKTEPGVMATRPATAPEQMPSTVGLPFMTHSTIIQVKPAVGVAVWVPSMAMPACRPAVTAEPALKPNQPTHSKEAPIIVSTTLWAGPVSVRLPSIRAHIRPAVPELTCTTVPPAKSSTLRKACGLAQLNMPPGPHTQWAAGDYTNVAHRPMNHSMAENFMRSPNAPATAHSALVAK